MRPAADTKEERARGASGVRLVSASPDFAIGTWQHIFIVIWRRETSVAGVMTVKIACDQFSREQPQGVMLYTVIREQASPPGTPARQALAKFLKAGHFIRASAVSMEGHSFRAAIVRGIVTGLTLLARQPFPHQVCTLQEASDLFEKESRRAQLEFDPKAFQLAIAEIKALVEGRLPT